MPFTATHVAAVLPVAWLCRWRLPLSALAIGSIVPDLSGFYPSIFDYPSTHSLRGVLTHCVPLGVIGFYLFHLLLKQPLVDLLPPRMSAGLQGWSRSEFDFRPMRILVVAGCVALGALTHVVWDSFTHGMGRGVAMFPQLEEVVLHYGGQSIRGYSVLQHGSSLLLLPPLTLGFLWWVLRQPTEFQRHPDRAAMPRSVSWTALAMIVVGGWLYFNAILNHQVNATWVAALRTAVKHCGAALFIILIAYCIGMQLTWWYQSRRDTEESSGFSFDTDLGARLCAGDSAHRTLPSRARCTSDQPIMISDGNQPPLDPVKSERSDPRS